MKTFYQKLTSKESKEKLYRIIFESDTPQGKLFDVILIVSILLSVMVVMLDSVKRINVSYGMLLYGIEWFFTILFTIEYILRLLCTKKPIKYATSFFGIVDLLAILPTYASLLILGSRYLIVIRILRVLRIFRILKLVQYVSEGGLLLRALYASRRKVIMFLFTVLTLVVIFGSLMYVIEGKENGLTSIPRSIYWAIVTLTTVGYGDISPKTNLGQAIAALVMILGYAIIAVPTGIVTVELSRVKEKKDSSKLCPRCSRQDHEPDANFCKYCGTKLPADTG
ncbi:MAG: ion transporter [Deltaproteobacteria bacterium]|nr:ion transporter [Deltaproteobacteria bacterium]